MEHLLCVQPRAKSDISLHSHGTPTAHLCFADEKSEALEVGLGQEHTAAKRQGEGEVLCDPGA